MRHPDDMRICACGEEVGPFTLAQNPNAVECSECTAENQAARKVASELEAKAASTNTHDEGGEQSAPPALKPGRSEQPSDAPSATEKSADSVESQPSTLAGDRARAVDAYLPVIVRVMADAGEVTVCDIWPFERRKSEAAEIRVEWWIYAITTGIPGTESLIGKVGAVDASATTEVLLSNWRELHLAAARRFAEVPKRHRFVVILEWQPGDNPASRKFDVGATFEPKSSSREHVAAAINTATKYAECEAIRLGLKTRVWSYDPPREF